jgi:hypothetical protein
MLTISLKMTVEVIAIVLNLVILMKMIMVSSVIYGPSTDVCYDTGVHHRHYQITSLIFT